MSLNLRLLSFVLFFSLPAVFAYAGKMSKESRPVANFNGIAISGYGELNVVQGSSESLTIEADEEVMHRIKSEVKDNTLHLGLESEKGLSWRVFKTDQPIRYYVTVKTLESLASSGSTNIKIGPLTTDQLKVSGSGASRLNMEKLAAKQLNISLSGSQKAELSGQVEDQSIKLSGSASYTASDLTTTRTHIKASGSSALKVRARDELNVSISGSGKVEYWGTPRVTQKVSGSGSVTGRGI